MRRREVSLLSFGAVCTGAYAGVLGTFEKDESAEWQCQDIEHLGLSAEWCAEAGIQGGWEYRHFSEGGSSPCSPCQCCRRLCKAKVDDPNVKVSQDAGFFDAFPIKLGGIPDLPSGYLAGNRGFEPGMGGGTSGDTFTITHSSGFTLFKEYDQIDAWNPANIAHLKLLGKALSFDVDLSSAGCGCNVAFYLISMPALGFGGEFSRGDNRGDQPPYYCDANQVGGQWCPEMDIMEANTHAFQKTPHKCDPPNENGHYANCDRGGCEQNTRDITNAYGPGSQYTIDTRKPFNVETGFPVDNGKLVGVRTILRQGDKQVELDGSSCEASYLESFSEHLSQGMSLRISYWGKAAETMAWMDAPPCGAGTCTGENSGDATISNITVYASPKYTPLPAPAPAQPEWQWDWNQQQQQQQQWGWDANTPAPPAPPAPSVEEQERIPDVNPQPVKIHGIDGTLMLAGKGGSTSGDRISLDHYASYTLFKEYQDRWSPDKIYQLKLLGKAITFNVDLSKVGCACNLAFYLTDSPARDAGGKLSIGTDRGEQPPYYCDASNNGGQMCPEIGIMNANNHAFQVDPHKCDDPVNGHYTKCDGRGCPQTTEKLENSFGPGEQFTIDTRKPFTVRTEFPMQAGVASGMKTVLMQSDREVVMDSCEASYMEKFSDVLSKGMSLRISYWGRDSETMEWLDGRTCQTWEKCEGGNAGTGEISNITVSAIPNFVWVVSSFDEEMPGARVPPEVINGDASNFVTMGNRGVAKWRGKTHYVELKETGSLPSDCTGGKPCKTGVDPENINFMTVGSSIMKKDDTHSLGAAAHTIAGKASSQSTQVFMVIGGVVAVALLLALVGVRASSRQRAGSESAGGDGQGQQSSASGTDATSAMPSTSGEPRRGSRASPLLQKRNSSSVAQLLSAMEQNAE